jgi:hypothetical protein
MATSDGYGFWSRALAMATLKIWRDLRRECEAKQARMMEDA